MIFFTYADKTYNLSMETSVQPISFMNANVHECEHWASAVVVCQLGMDVVCISCVHERLCDFFFFSLEPSNGPIITWPQGLLNYMLLLDTIF